MTAVALTIAGSDSSGGAGIQADLKTFAAFAVFGTSAITAITAQNTRGVSAIVNLDPSFVAAQIDAVADDFAIAAAKTGMLSRAEIISAVADRIRTRTIPNVVVDPVMVAASGDVLLEPDAIAMMRDVMLPLATVVTPNLREASILTGRDVSNRDAIREAARALVGLGARAALVKGGNFAAVALAGEFQQDAIDIFYDGHNFREFRAPRVEIGRAHGAGCTLSAAIAASLARGESLEGAIDAAKRYVTLALQNGPPIGHGSRPLNHSVSALHTFPKSRETHSMTTRRSFTESIRVKAQPIWDRELKHPFVRGLGDGTLPSVSGVCNKRT
jgi:hydroxymethylpyrimidine/phosphomethylpyrimidine kinase